MFGFVRLTSKCCSNRLTKIASVRRLKSKSTVTVGKRNLFIAGTPNMSENFVVNKDELRKKLTPIQYHVTQEKGTERPFSGTYNKVYDEGLYTCIVCEQALFSSNTKYDSSCGWPAFNDVLEQGKVKLTPDTSGVGANLLLLISQPGRIRTEVTCAKCGSHLGHVFNDGPPPTKKRFCINSASLNFIPKAGDSKE